MAEDAYPSDDEIRGLANLDDIVFGDQSVKQRAQGIFERNAADAAMTIISIAKGSANDNTRLRAAQYVVDRSMGPMSSTAPPLSGEKDELQEAMATFANAIAADEARRKADPKN